MPKGKLLLLFLAHHKEARDDVLMKPDGQSCCTETQPWSRRRLEQHRLPLKRGNLPFYDTPRTGKLWKFHLISHGFAQILVWGGRSHSLNTSSPSKWSTSFMGSLDIFTVIHVGRIPGLRGSKMIGVFLVLSSGFVFSINWYNRIGSSGNKATFIL